MCWFAYWVNVELQTANVACFQRKIQFSGLSAYSDVSPSQLIRISGVVLLYLNKRAVQAQWAVNEAVHVLIVTQEQSYGLDRKGHVALSAGTPCTRNKETDPLHDRSFCHFPLAPSC